MENVNEERSLVKVDNSIFAKMRRFFHNIFSRKNNAAVVEENIVESNLQDKSETEEEHAQPKLFNFDNPQNYYGMDKDEKQSIEENPEDIHVDSMTQNSDKMEDVDEEVTTSEKQEYIGISKYFEDVDDNYIGKSKKQVKPERKDGYEEKEELEQKLMNYYASIKKVMQQ